MLIRSAFLALTLAAGAAQAAPIAITQPWTAGWKNNAAATAENGNTLKFTSSSDDASVRKLGKPQSANTGIVVDFWFEYSGRVDNNDFLGLWLANSTDKLKDSDGPNIGFKANCGPKGSCKDDVFVRLGGTDGFYIKDSNLVQGQKYHLMGHLYKTGSTKFYDSFDAWLNPTAAEIASLSNPDAHATGKANVSAIDLIGFRSYGVDSTITMRVSDLNVRAVPEPGTLALFGLALAGVATLRRKRA
ncbi:hypothetical protein B0920_17605 [Massilia sp. KIM]|uniref:PEP-CTERM sorting domain-containing protein n=1 Tax=Massilia sp. KIM TaxID=1955422 RepID=UPI0009D299CA|nr:PEP-CTERM sorting domain-containing protein [Massilia sp. KIM]OON60769.1 hypothetical protein B0920_17605 [Massilia sp. KIM]